MRVATKREANSAVALAEFLVGHGGSEESAFLDVLAHIADRGNLIEFCERNGIRVGLLIGWIRRDADRSRRYEMALMDRRSLDAEAVRGKWSEVMDAKPETAPRWSDVLKASEMMGKYSGVLNDGPVNVDRDAMSEGELRSALAELLERNPDVKTLIAGSGFGGVDVVDGELTGELVGGVAKAVGEVVHEATIADPVVADTAHEPATEPERKPLREVSEEAKAARAVNVPKPKEGVKVVGKWYL